jgi:predicted extracellular nuclease
MQTRCLVIRGFILLTVIMLYSCQSSEQGGAVSSVQAEELKIAFWNAENVLDQYKDPQLEADEALPVEHVKKKLENISRVILQMNPDIIGLMEIENHQLLRELVSRHLIKSGYQHFVLLEGRDIRGIDVALVSKYPFMVRSFAIPNFPRGIMAARFVFNGQPMYVLVNHWKSRRDGGDDSGESQRMKAAETLLQIVKSEISKYEGREVPIIMGGDFNDTDSDKSLQVLTNGGMINTLEHLSREERWTHFYIDREGEVELMGIDHILSNKLFLKGHGYTWKTSEVVRPKIMSHDRSFKGRHYQVPLDDYKDRIGFSDHFPVMATVEIESKP